MEGYTKERRRQIVCKKKGRRLRFDQCRTMHHKRRNSLAFYVANSEEYLIRGVSAAEKINTRETITSVKFKKQTAKELKEK